MTLTEYSELSQIIQNIVISIGLISGGVWAATQFFLLRSINKAKVEIQTIEENLRRKPQILTTLKFNSLQIDGNNILMIDVVLENWGNFAESINPRDCKIVITPVEITESRDIGYSEKTFQAKQYIDPELPYFFLSPGTKEKIQFLAYLPSRGLYFIDFTAVASPYSAEHFHSEIIKNRNPFNYTSTECDLVWNAAEYFHLE